MALQDLRTYFKETNRTEFMDMLKNKCVVTEKIQASSFHARRGDTGYEFYKSGLKTPMSRVDRTIVKYYENAISHFNSIPDSVKAEMPMDWKFGFDYMTSTKTVDVEYDNLPKNHLILTHIQVLNPTDPTQVKKVIRDPKVLERWATMLDVNSTPIIFEGILASNQKEELIRLLEMSDDSFESKFQSEPFTRKVYNIFNKHLSRTTLNEGLEAEIDSLVVSFVEGKKIKGFKLSRKLNVIEEEREASDMYQISILDLVEYLSDYNIEGMDVISEENDLRYLEIMSTIFNDYIGENAVRYIGADFDSAGFASKPGFELNKGFLTNEKTIELVSNQDLSELFKIMLGSFRKKRTKETKIINADLMAQMNEIVSKIEDRIMMKQEESSIMTYNTFMKAEKIQSQVSPIEEAFTVKFEEQGKKPVNMFVGRFQPFTLGHAKVIDRIHKENGYPVVIFLVKAKKKKKEDGFKRPYSEEMQVKMLNQLKAKYPIEEVFIVNSAAIDVMFNMMRPKYEPVLWGTGSDRMKVYGYQVDNDKYRGLLGVRDDFSLFEIPRTGKNISATQVRNAMLDDDIALFKKLVPKEIHSMYDELKTTLEHQMAAAESVVNESESIMTFNEFISK